MSSVLLTGSKGFIGKALKAKLQNENHDILELDLENGGVTNPVMLDALLPLDITHVFHLAGKTFVPESWENPGEYFTVNTFGTKNVLEFCRKKGSNLTFVSAYIYGQPECLPISEDAKVCPDNPYAYSKYLAEQLCVFYAREFGLKINILRPFNAYGIGQNKRFLIPRIIDQALNKSAITLKDLSPKRDYIYLNDLVMALICSMTFNGNFSVYNIGSGSSISVQGVVDIVLEILGVDKPVISERVVRKNELSDVVADISKAKAGLKWSPKYSFREGIKKIIENEIGKNHVRG